jgi:hypothetical protein
MMSSLLKRKMMNLTKRTVLLLLISFSIGTASYGQKFTVGLKLGGNTNWAAYGDKESKDTFDTKTFYGYSAGFQIGFPLKNDYNLMLEGAYSKRGRKVGFQSDGAQWIHTIDRQMIEASMLLRKSFKFQLYRNVPGEWFINIGPDIGYWFAGNGRLQTNDNEPFEYTVKWNEPQTDNFYYMYYNGVNRWYFGLAFGGGLKTSLRNNQRIAVELRYISGHTYLGNYNSAYINIPNFYNNMKTNMKSLNLSVTYFLEFDVQEGRKGKSTVKKRMKRSR